MGIEILVATFLAVLFLGVLYFLVAMCLDFSYRKIKKDFTESSQYTDSLEHLVKISFRKVNGWNRFTTFYTVLHYVLNFSCIIFSCVSIYATYMNFTMVSILSSMISILSLICNLFLKCERKWATFRKVLARARTRTNDFIATFKDAPDLAAHTRIFANDIINFEDELDDRDLT